MDELKYLNESYFQSLKSNLEFLLYDRSELCTIRQIAMTSSTPTLPPLLHYPHLLPMAKPLPLLFHHRLPVSSLPNLSLITGADFYPWFSSVLNGFTLTRCNNPAKLVLTLQAIPLNKRGSFNTITNWTNFKARVIEEFGSIDIFGRDVNQIFDLLPCYESVQEVAEDLAPKIKTLLANLEIIQQFHNVEDLHNVAITPNLVQNVMRSLPWR